MPDVPNSVDVGFGLPTLSRRREEVILRDKYRWMKYQ